MKLALFLSILLPVLANVAAIKKEPWVCGKDDHAFCEKWPQRHCTDLTVQLYWCPLKCGICNVCGDIQDEKDLINNFKKDSNEFAWNLYQRGRAEEKGNMVFSPASISIALGMTMQGANNETMEEMKNLIAPNVSDDRVAAVYRQLYENVNTETDNYQLYTANTVYIHEALNLLKEFKNRVINCFKSQAQLVNFEKNSVAVKKQINKWVEDKTNGKIKDLIKELETSTKMVLVNALYFKAEWLHRFDKNGNTFDMQFYSNGVDETATTVKFMKQKHQFKYAEDDNVQVLCLPYKGEQVTMHIFLPKTRDGLADFESKISGDYLDKLLKKTTKQVVEVYLPKFKIEQKYPLKTVLQNMGMVKAFSQKDADFSGMTGSRNLYVGDAIHKAVIEVNEKGTEAAAATAVIVMPTSLFRGPYFRADHPFVFGLKHQISGHWLFVGSLVKM